MSVPFARFSKKTLKSALTCNIFYIFVRLKEKSRLNNE